jgi:hypothetical protein
MKTIAIIICLFLLIACNKDDIKISEPKLAFAVTDLSVGSNRLAFGIIKPRGGTINTKTVTVDTYYLGDQDNPQHKETLIAKFEEWPQGNGVYVCETLFDQSGKWGIGVTINLDGTTITTSTYIEVRQYSKTPAIGVKAIRSKTPKYTPGQDLSEITSDTNPYIPFYDMTLNEALDAKKPLIITFATPAFCKTATCGPQMEILKIIDKSNEFSANFLHIEIYKNPNKILGNINEAELSEAALMWNIPSEPWTFIVDSNGNIIKKFEGLVTANEILGILNNLK